MLRGPLLSLLLIFAALFGSVVAPETVHAEQVVAVEQAAETLHDSEHRHGSGQGEERGGAPCHSGLHHHCNVAISGSGDALSLAQLGPAQVNAPFLVKPLVSLLSAPPFEPPAA